MLVLTRKDDERIYIGDDIIITIVKTGRDSVRLGIDAPANYKILREELLPNNEKEAKGQENA